MIYCLEQYTLVEWDITQTWRRACQDTSSNVLVFKTLLRAISEMIQFLKLHFNQDLIYLAGHSWASVPALLFAKKNPEMIKAYMGIGQIVDYLEGENMAYDFIISCASRKTDLKSLKKIESLGRPPYKNKKSSYLKWQALNQWGGITYQKSIGQMQMKRQGVRSLLLSKAGAIIDSYSESDKNASIERTLSSIHFPEQINAIEVPLYFCCGRYDYVTPSALVEKYQEQLIAPHKQITWFEKSAHYLYLEEKEAFTHFCLSVLNRELNSESLGHSPDDL